MLDLDAAVFGGVNAINEQQQHRETSSLIGENDRVSLSTPIQEYVNSNEKETVAWLSQPFIKLLLLTFIPDLV